VFCALYSLFSLLLQGEGVDEGVGADRLFHDYCQQNFDVPHLTLKLVYSSVKDIQHTLWVHNI
jgi:hypothetical protein